MNAATAAPHRQLTVYIMGQTYVLACPPDGEAALQQAVQRVDRVMCSIQDAGRIRTRDRISVLAAINLAFELTQAEAAGREASRLAAQQLQTEAQLQALLARLDAALAS
ncbi:cell division protein ZapA [Macromonas bipunctata]|jgi:cell division protein ZapA|uniref:cell division protein ZapA n=1 Tax=Macromonas bipunctata TaxID=183670 RepID=UPI000C33DA78|nr:cell division protein ZapA [Macromonas bipunctata]